MASSPPQTGTVDKNWAKGPLPVTDVWQTRYAASTMLHWSKDRATLQEALDATGASEDDPVLSVAKYETLALTNSGVYFNFHVAQLDECDHDITRNLQVLTS